MEFRKPRDTWHDCGIIALHTIYPFELWNVPISMFNAMVDISKAALRKIHASQRFFKIVFSHSLYIMC